MLRLCHGICWHWHWWDLCSITNHSWLLILARQGAGLGRTAGLDTLGAALLSVCDGELTARQAVAAIAGLLDLDAAQAHEQAVALLRELVADGFVAGGVTDRG